MQFLKHFIIVAIISFLIPSNVAAENFSNVDRSSEVTEIKEAKVRDNLWHSIDENGKLRVKFYFFWSETCPHCHKAKPYIERLPEMIPWLDLISDEISTAEGWTKYEMITRGLGEKAGRVPAFIACGKMSTGYNNAKTTGKYLYDQIVECHKKLTEKAKSGDKDSIKNAIKEIAAEEDPLPPVDLPIIGTIDPTTLSLPALTIALAGVDAFNPCAFFVLLFLLSLMVNAKSRAKMLLVGGVFVVFSGLIYFVFMAAWLNLFLIVGQIALVTLVAGGVALVIGVLNIKDFFFFKQGPSLSISDENKAGLFKKMSGLVASDNLGTVLLGTVVLSITANAYELLCTAGFPMVFTRILTLNELDTFGRYMYLAFYNIIYVVPLAVIVVLFTATLGKRKLSEEEGRVLKLLSGTMMSGLGLMLLLAPETLQNGLLAFGLILVALVLTFIFVLFDKFVISKQKNSD